MKALLLWPRFPPTFWSFEGVLSLVGRKALLPPLGLATVAALLPEEWEFRLIDRNVSEVSDEDFDWADIVLLSGMIVQRDDCTYLIEEAGRRGKPVVVGGPYATSVPQDFIDAGADYLVVDEGEITIPIFLEHIAQHGLSKRAKGAGPVIFSAGERKPEVSTSPVPRFDLFDFSAYDGMCVQFSRGCPFLCEFCDIITLYGRKPRTKGPAQFLEELDRLFELGWRGSIFLVDDNFIGNKRNVKQLLGELLAWQKAHGFPFWFDTEASIDLAADTHLMDLMVRCHFASVFIGIETPDQDSLALTRKHQNNRSPLEDSVRTITRKGLRIMCGLIVGFDGEAKGAGSRIVEFIERTAIPTPLLSMLQALPNTALWTRLEREGRLLGSIANLNQTTTLNFVPTRPARDIIEEHAQAFWALYDPRAYTMRVYRCLLELGAERPAPDVAIVSCKRPAGWSRLQALRDAFVVARAFGIVVLRQGIMRESRFTFWLCFMGILIKRPDNFERFITLCAHNEHFLVYRIKVRASAEKILSELPPRVELDTRAIEAPEEITFV